MEGSGMFVVSIRGGRVITHRGILPYLKCFRKKANINSQKLLNLFQITKRTSFEHRRLRHHP